MIDTNVLVSALRSNRGASFQLIQEIGRAPFKPIVSTPLFFEYEEILKRPTLLPLLTALDIDEFLDYFLTESDECNVHYLWRPFLSDPDDDLLLELAVAGGAQLIVTHNVRDFARSGEFGIRAVTPGEFLSILGI